LAPIIQNKFRGLRYCGFRSELTFRKMKRPVPQKKNAQGIITEYAFPAGYVPCQPGFLGKPEGADYVVCRKEREMIL